MIEAEKILAEIRKEKELHRDAIIKDMECQIWSLTEKLAIAVKALEWITQWGQVHDAHSLKASEALRKVRGDDHANT